MNETLETKLLTKSPLDAVHQRLGATMIERDGWSVPASYGDVLREYAAVREGGCGLSDLSARGRLLVSGTEAVQFLNGLITNDMKTLAEYSWMPAAFPNVQGRLIASVRVIHLKANQTGMTTPAGLPRRGPRANACPTFLIDTEAATHASVLKTIERFTLAGDFHVRDVTSETAMLSVQGSKAAALVSAVLGEAAGAITESQMSHIAWSSGDKTTDKSENSQESSDSETNDAVKGVIAIRASHAMHMGENGFDLVVNAADAASLWNALQAAGAQPVGDAALEILRIEAGRPRFGVDMDETNIVTEVLDDLDGAVSYTKGCYVGQEIIARIKYRGHVAKKLSGVAFEQTVKVAAGATIKSTDGKEVGRITSVTDSPQLSRTIALAFLKYDYLATGTSVKIVAGDGELPAQVAELPFVRGSWYEEGIPAAD